MRESTFNDIPQPPEPAHRAQRSTQINLSLNFLRGDQERIDSLQTQILKYGTQIDQIIGELQPDEELLIFAPDDGRLVDPNLATEAASSFRANSIQITPGQVEFFNSRTEQKFIVPAQNPTTVAIVEIDAQDDGGSGSALAAG